MYDHAFDDSRKSSNMPVDSMQDERAAFTQQVIDDSDKIFDALKSSLAHAKFEILVASLWFTDPILFDIILERLKANVKVDIVISENIDNEKLPFEKITEAGGFFIKIKGADSGVTRQKFCVIDRREAIYGSYNFSINARNNNQGNVIYTTHRNTVQELIEAFAKIKARAIAIKNGVEAPATNDSEYAINKPNVEGRAISNPAPKATNVEDFQKELNTLIEAEINHFDRNALRQSGLDNSRSCSGDFSILNNALDTVYYNFTTDINISNEKKERLLLKLNDLKAKKIQELDSEAAKKKEVIKIEHTNKKEVSARIVKDKKAEVEKNVKKIEHINQIDIADRRKTIAQHRDKIAALRSEYIIPKHKLFDLIPLLIINGFLLTYLILFYSSAAYILIYSKQDIQSSLNKGLVPTINVFEPNAIFRALNHGAVGVMYILIFPILLIACTLIERFIDNKKLGRFISNVVGLFFVDILVAVLISKLIHDTGVRTNQIDTSWNYVSVLTDVNFYLVFVMGSMALLIFRFTFNKLILSFAERDTTLSGQRAKVEIEAIEGRIESVEQEITEFEKGKANIIIDNIENERVCKEHEHILDELPAKEARELQNIEGEYTRLCQRCEHIANMYINKIENNNSKISLEALKDRINIYLEGWNKFLHDYFSNSIAKEKSTGAIEIANTWLGNKLNNNIDELKNNP